MAEARPTADTLAPHLLWAPHAWVDGRWQDAVLLDIDAQGCWRGITAGAKAPAVAQQLPGPVLPGLVNSHSHAFQRAFAGLTERRAGDQDDFWSWRQQMYDLALRVTPEALRQIATRLYRELLRGGYTQVCEFHYLHHAPDGKPYAAAHGGLMAMSQALIDAAQDSGIGLTLLPVLYERAGFTQAALRDEQRRFGTDVDQVLALRDGVRAMAASRPQAHISAGVAIHSLRAARPESIAALARRVADDAGPVHIHIAEQTGEVDDCLATTGQRPVDWLCSGLGQGPAQAFTIDARWHLVHATHVNRAEIDAVAVTGAGMVLCPSTEANLGDGLSDLPHWLNAGVPVSIGSDSHVTRDWREELRLAEYGQRLLHRQRNVLATPLSGEGATAARLFGRALSAGGDAAGFARWGLEVGARADLLVIDMADSSLHDIAPGHLLDALVFSSPVKPFAMTLVGGRWTGT
jgi:formimidoylglutamate deiminase